jgi:membrane protease YdiL (CAAX protease family)
VAGWLEHGAGLAGPLRLVYPELALAFTLLVSVLHFRSLRKTRSEIAAVRLYFAAFFALSLAAPVLIVFLTSAEPGALLAASGWTLGKARLGLLLTAVGLPLAVLSGFVGSRDLDMKKMYPFAKDACAGVRTFIGYELSYFLLYYVPWESVFRGVLFLPLVPVLGLVPALAIQTTVSTLLHIGHPDKELFAAAGAGVVFGLIAWATGSFLYPLVLHAATGVATDTFLFLRRDRRAP